MEDLVEKLIRHIAKTDYDSLPQEVVTETKKYILDTIGVGLAGVHEPGCKEVVDLVKAWSGNERGSSIIFYGGKVSPADAAFANSVMMHALDFDDTLDSSAIHLHVSSLPAALAMAEISKKVSGKELITAVALGVDITYRIADAVQSPLSWIRTATCGSFGAAASAAKILNGEEKQIANALGVVYSQTSGNAQCLVDGGLVKRMQPAFSARNGVLSAELGFRGITGAVHILEGEYGFFKLYERGQVRPERVTERLGEHFGVMELSIKPYPCCRMTHASIDTALEIFKSHKIDPKKIDEVLVHVSRMVSDMVGSPFTLRDNPQVDAQFSIPYTVALALEVGAVTLNDFISETVKSRDSTIELSKKVKVVTSPELSDKDISVSDITVKMLNGDSFSDRVNAPKGSPLRPMTFDECYTKFKQCLEYSHNKSAIEKGRSLSDFIFDLEKKKDIRDLFEYL